MKNMIITIAGDPGSGKSTVAKAVAKALGMKHFSAGDFMRQMAEERGISLMELTRQSEKDKEIDIEIDKRTQELAKKENNFVIDSRIGFHFIPDSIKIFLKTDPKKAAERTWKDIQSGKRAQEKQYKSQDEVMKAIIERQQIEKRRYLKHYNVDMLDMSNYEFILDATDMSLQEEIDAVLEYIKKVM
jgi:cytidylate kinase